MRHLRRLLTHPLFSGSVIMIGGNMLVNILNYFYHLIMGRVLGPIEYGILASLYSILYIFGIVPVSTSYAVVKFIAGAKNKSELARVYNTINHYVLRLALVCLLVILFFSPYLARFLNIGNIGSVTIVGMILFFILLTLVNQSVAQGMLRFSGSVAPNLISSAFKFVLGIMLVFLGWKSFGAMIGVLFAALLAYLYSYWFVKYRLKIESGKLGFDIKKFLKYTFPVLMQAVAFTSLFTTDVILVKHFFPPFEAGIYAAISMLGKIIYFAVSPITAAMFPIVTGRNSRGESFKKVFWMSLFLTLAGSSVIVAFYRFFPSLAIGLLYGKAYLVAKNEVFLMGLFLLFYTLSSFLVNFFLSIGKVKISFLPVAFSILQIIGIWFYHDSLRQVIEISLSISAFLLVTIIIYLGYNQLWLKRNFFR